MKLYWSEKKLNRNEMISTVLETILLSSLVLVVIFATVGFYPFGDNSILTWDLKTQYIDFLTYFRRELPRGTKGLLYTQSISLGAETYGLLAYYLFSPFNIILFLFPIEKIIGAIEIIIILKYIMAAVAMCVLIKYKYAIDNLVTIICAVSYSFCGFMVANQFNIMWVDGVILLPLLVLGLEKLFARNNKTLLITVLILSVFSNYYMGYMLWLFALLYAGAYLAFVNSENKRKTIIHGFFAVLTALIILSPHLIKTYEGLLSSKMTGIGVDSSSALKTAVLVLAVIGAFIFAGAIKKLINGYTEDKYSTWKVVSSNIIGIFVFAVTFVFIEISELADSWIVALPTKMILGAFNYYEVVNGMPNIYVPSIIILSTFMLVCTNNASLKIKDSVWRYMAIFLALWISFAVRRLNIFWHGMNYPSGSNYRYSFMMSFVLIIMAAELFSFLKKDEVEIRVQQLGVLIVLYAVWFYYSLQKYVENKNIYVYKERLITTIITESICLIVVFCYLIWRKTNKKRIILYVGAILTVIEICLNAVWTLGNMQYTKYSGYISEYTVEQKLVDSLRKDEDVYRIEFWKDGQNKTLRYGCDSVSTYASTLPYKVIQTLDGFGMTSDGLGIMSAYANDNLTSKELGLLNIKYIISNCEQTRSDLVELKRVGDYTVYYNQDWQERAFLIDNNQKGESLRDCLEYTLDGVKEISWNQQQLCYQLLYDTNVERLLVITNINDGKWHATVDGEDVDVEDVLGGVIGIRVPAGEHKVVVWR